MQIEKIKKALFFAGFKYIKLELEGNVEPPDYPKDTQCDYCYEGRVDCSHCDGAGTVSCDCSRCEGTGYIKDKNGKKTECEFCNGEGCIEEDCDYCNGDGSLSCEECGGDGYFEDNDWETPYLEDFEEEFRAKLNGIDKHFKYLSIYNDGSVDTEITCTLRVNYIDKLPDIVKAFKDTCLHFGECETNNAGIHITLLEGYKYPRSKKLNQAKLYNFKKQVPKLLLGLTYLASPDEQTRAFNYRELQISDKEKYSAIYTHGNTVLEYRLFDCCYQKPEAILNYLSLIVKTLRYYTANPKKAIAIKGSFTPETTDKILKKHHNGTYEKLTKIYNTRESRTRLFNELVYLVDSKAKNLLNDLTKLNNPCLMSVELFNIIKQV